MTSEWNTMNEVFSAEAFPDVDLMLRSGRHIDREDGDRYTFLIDAQEPLEAFYRRFGCELVRKSDGYFYLLPTTDRLGRRHLSSGEMLVGQALTLMFLDPAAVEHGGVVTREQVLAQLAGVLGAESFVRAMNPKRRRPDPRIAEETARTKVAEALRRLAALGFVTIVDETRLKLRPALLRFAEPVRGSHAPEAALKRLIDEGELILVDAAGESEGESEGEKEEAEDATERSGRDPNPSEHEG